MIDEADSNVFGDIYSQPENAASPNPAPAEPAAPANPFADIYAPSEADQTSAPGAFMHGLERGILPAAAGLAGVIPGAEAGAVIGGGAGAFFGGVGAAPGAAIGAVVGGFAGAFGGSAVVSNAQDWALDALPETWQDALGQSQQQRAREEKYQPTASFLGGLVPYALTMKPSAGAMAVLQPNATAFQKIIANPMTARVFGGAISGGMELGQESATGREPNWTNVAIATGFGMVFNHPNRIGQKLTDVGAVPGRVLRGETAFPETAAPAAPAQPETPAPTVAQAGDLKVMGPGITEEVFNGGHAQAPDAAMTVQDSARTEAATLRPESQPTADVHSVARQMEFELFNRYDEAAQRRADLETRLRQVEDPEAPEQPVEAAAIQKQIAATEAEIRDMAPEVSAAYRRAADAVQGEVVEPEAPVAPQAQEAPAGSAETVPAHRGPEGVTSGEPQISIPDQIAAIAEQVANELIAAGRPEAEARGSGQLLGNYYATRAKRFTGPGAPSPLDLFRQRGAVIRRAGPPATAPLIPTMERPNISAAPEPIAAPEVPRVEPAVEGAAQSAAPSANPPSELESLDPMTIGVDANRFQFKAGGDEAGVTERLQDVGQWDPRLAGTVLVWRDEAGKNWIADGHQRAGLARRLTAAGQPNIRLNAFVLDAAHGVTDVQARVIAAIKNIAEGTGSPIDAAKVLRVAEETGMSLPPLPPRSTLVREGRAISKLSPDAFGMIVNEIVPPAQGAIVARLVTDPAQQSEAIRLLAKFQPDNARQAEMIVRDMISSGTENGTQQSLFGEEAFASSIVLERAKVAEEALKQLRRDKSTFRTLVDEAERIQGQGENILDQQANQSRLTTDEQAAELLTQLAFRAGPVSDELSRISRRLKSGEISAAAAAREFLVAVRTAVESGVDTGADAGRPVAGAAGVGEGAVEPPDPNQSQFFQSGKPAPWREGEKLGEFDTERGLEGLPQSLIPGVKPVTDLDRMALEAGKPLKGGAAPPPKGSLFDVEGREEGAKQLTLFQRMPGTESDERTFNQPAYHGTPHIFDKFELSDKTLGTGEGAQAFGHGLYMAGAKDVAKFYRDTLTGDVIAPAQRALKNAGDDINAAISAAQAEISRLNDLALTPETGSAKRASLVAKQQSNLRELEAYRATGNWKSGRLLTVDIPHDDELLNWDKPFNEQPPKVKEALAKLGIVEGGKVERIADPDLRYIVEAAIKQNDGDASRDSVSLIVDNDSALYKRAAAYAKKKGVNVDDLADGVGSYIEDEARDYLASLNARYERTGEKIYRELSRKLAGPPPEETNDWTSFNTGTSDSDMRGDAAASVALREAGIPGHRFLDQQSRGKTEGQTHNYVIYDDSKVNITNYEQPKRGAITFVEGRKPLIRLFADADASTFIHETGHQWLEEMMADAQHPAIDARLKADAQVVRDWLGIGEDGRIKTAQHEKFARGFEQYMREGVAPSAGLARVFAQFKSWLTSIYQSVQSLGSPINEDIRGVFDRMLAEEPRRSVVAPEAEPRSTLTDMHEAEAANAQPHEAETIADRITADNDAYLTNQPPEVQNELAAAVAEQEAAAAAAAGADAGTEAGTGPAGGPEVVAGGGQPEPVAPGSSSGGQSGPVVSGGAASVAAGADAGLRNQRPGAAGNAGSHPLAPSATDLFGPAESPFTDKAGNIRIENLTSEEDVGQAIRDAANESNDFIGDRRGVITDGQVLDLADALGMDAAMLNQRQIGQAFNAEQVMAARKLLIQSATDVSVAMKKAATGTDEDVLAYAQIKARHQMIQGHVAGITAEAGRALRAFRNIAGQEQAMGVDQFVRSATGKTLFQLREEAKLGAQLDTPQKVSKFMWDSQKQGFGDMLLEYWINALLSGPKTQVVNFVSNGIASAMKAGPDTAVAAMIGSIARAAGRKGETVRLGEVAAQLRGAARSLPSATVAAIDAFKTGKSILLPGETPREQPELTYMPQSEFAREAALDETAKIADIAPHLFGATQGILDGIVAIGRLVKTGGDKGSPLVSLRRSPLGAIPDIAVRGTTVVPAGTVLRIPTRMLAANDTFSRAVNFAMEKNALAYRKAAEEGLTGQAFDARVADIVLNPSTEVMERSRTSATDLVMMSRRSEFVNALTRLANTKIVGFPLLKFVVPFINAPANIIEQMALRRTPLGLFSPELRADLTGKNGTIAQDTAAARMLLGSAVSIGFGFLAAKGLATGSGPSDPNDAALWRLAGNQPHSVRIGDMWYQTNQLGPVGMLTGVAADLYDIAHAASEGDVQKVGAELLQAFTQNILDASFMTGPSDLIEAVQDPSRYGQQYIRNFLSGFVPFSGAMGQVARSIDPYTRQARTVMDSVMAKVPGMSTQLMPRRDIWGQPIPNRTAVGSALYSPIYTQAVSKDPVNQEMMKSGYWPGMPDRKIRGVDLTDAQYDEYSKIAGQMAKQRLDVIVNSGEWQQWPATTRHDVIQETIRQSRETARGVMMARYPAIPAAAVRAKLAGLNP